MKMQRKRLPSSAAAIIGGKDDLLTEILVLLPAKSIVRFRVVSKQWRSLINSESFRHKHWVNRRRRRPQHQFILHTAAKPHKTVICDLTAKTLLPLRFDSLESEYDDIIILQSSHGLLLLECRSTACGGGDILLYNPITQQHRLLRYVPADQEFSRFCFIFDPSKSYDYTVFCLTTSDYTDIDNYTDIDVYDSRTREWESKGISNETLYHDFPQGVLCNDRLFFIRCWSPSMCFNPNNEVMISAVASPHPPRCRSFSFQKKYVVESNGHLHYLVVSNSKMHKINLLYDYEMIHNKRWVIGNRRVDSERPLSASFGAEKIEILGFVSGERKEEEEDSILVYHVPGKIMSYRFRDRVSEEIVDFSNESFSEEGSLHCSKKNKKKKNKDSLQFEFKDSHHFIESFVSV